jgi:hypothetical protein
MYFNVCFGSYLELFWLHKSNIPILRWQSISEMLFLLPTRCLTSRASSFDRSSNLLLNQGFFLSEIHILKCFGIHSVDSIGLFGWFLRLGLLCFFQYFSLLNQKKMQPVWKENLGQENFSELMRLFFIITALLNFYIHLKDLEQ